LALVEYYGTGRRKTSTARVHLRQGTGEVVVNRRNLDDYFPNEVLKMLIKQPLSLTETVDRFDIVVTVDGGGPTGRLARSVTESPARCSATTASFASGSRRPDSSRATRA